jgi:hypothetical protein
MHLRKILIEIFVIVVAIPGICAAQNATTRGP